jgi:hypothetical protein
MYLDITGVNKKNQKIYNKNKNNRNGALPLLL